MGVRAYTPKLARFITPDPVGLKAGWNQHDALAGDPVNKIDADGRVAVLVVAAVATVAAVLVVNMSNNAREARERQLDREWDCNNLIPPEWGNGRPNRKGDGRRWDNPQNDGDGVRIDKGNPNSPLPSQRPDHVIVRRNGKVIGRDGQPIDGAIKDDPENAHIPKEEWDQWDTWDAP